MIWTHSSVPFEALIAFGIAVALGVRLAVDAALRRMR